MEECIESEIQVVALLISQLPPSLRQIRPRSTVAGIAPINFVPPRSFGASRVCHSGRYAVVDDGSKSDKSGQTTCESSMPNHPINFFPQQPLYVGCRGDRDGDALDANVK